MKSKFINVLMFAAGAAVGSAVTWKIVKTKYEQIVQEEIESIKEAFKDMPVVDQDTEETDDDESDQEQSRQINWEELEDLNEDDEDEYVPTEADVKGYSKLAGTYSSEKGGVESMAKEPYVISPYDFGEIDEYDQIELTYYEGDDTLEDDEYQIITDRDSLIGTKALLTFGEYEDDSVFVRNEYLRTDFQIIRTPKVSAPNRWLTNDL